MTRISYCGIFFIAMILLCTCNDNVAKEDLMGEWKTIPEYALNMVWESSEPLAVDGFSMTTPEIATFATQFSKDFLNKKVRSIHFKKDNNLEVTHLDESSNAWITEVLGTYRVISSTKFSFSPDVDKLFGGLAGVNPIMLEGIRLYAKAGISVHYNYVGNNTNEIHIYLNTTTFKEAKFLLPLLAFAFLEDNANDPVTQSILERIPAHLDKTSKVEVGFNYRR